MVLTYISCCFKKLRKKRQLIELARRLFGARSKVIN